MCPQTENMRRRIGSLAGITVLQDSIRQFHQVRVATPRIHRRALQRVGRGMSLIDMQFHENLPGARDTIAPRISRRPCRTGRGIFRRNKAEKPALHVWQMQPSFRQTRSFLRKRSLKIRGRQIRSPIGTRRPLPVLDHTQNIVPHLINFQRTVTPCLVWDRTSFSKSS